jgi:hypothetical protein
MTVFLLISGTEAVTALHGTIIFQGAIAAAEKVAVSLSHALQCDLSRRKVMPAATSSWENVVQVFSPPAGEQVVSVLLNHHDNEGNIVDSSTMELTQPQVSGIVDEAAQLCVVMRDMAVGTANIDDFNQVYSNLEGSLMQARILDPTDVPAVLLNIVRETQ